jgi:SPP1 gp7 family putative phage head morphogenesis protein
VLVPNLLGLSEQGSIGSYSQSQTQFDVYLWIIDTDTSSLEEALNEQMFKELALVNFGTEDYPPFRMGELDAKQKEALAKTWSALVKDGSVTNTSNDEKYTRSLLGYPELDEESLEEKPEGEIPDKEPSEEDIIDQLPEGTDIEPYMHLFKERAWLRRVKFKQIDKSMNKVEDYFIKDLNNTLGMVRLSINKQIESVAGKRSFGNIALTEFKELSIPKGLLSSIARNSREHLKKMFNSSYNLAKSEIVKEEFSQIVGMDKTRADKFLAQKSLKIKDVLNTDVLKNVQQILENGVKYDKTLASVMVDLESNSLITSVLPNVDAAGRTINVAARLENIIRTNTADAVNQARMSLFGNPKLRGFVVAYEYSAILDSRVSDICESLHGRIKKDWSECLPPNHFQCRSILVPITAIDEWDGKEDNIPSNIKPAQGFG